MIGKPEVTRTNYRVAIEGDDTFMLISKWDNELHDRALPPFVPLYKKIDKVDGVNDADYNGHFGASIFYRVEAEHDNEETHAEIRRLIQEHIDMAVSSEELTEVLSLSSQLAREHHDIDCDDFLTESQAGQVVALFESNMPKKFESRRDSVIAWLCDYHMQYARK